MELTFARGAAAHAVAIRVDAAPARGLPGVAGAWSAADLPDLPPAPGPPGVAFGGPERFALACDAVQFAGEPVAVVAAESRAFAEDAAERVSVVPDELPPLLDAVEGGSARGPGTVSRPAQSRVRPGIRVAGGRRVCLGPGRGDGPLPAAAADP